MYLFKNILFITNYMEQQFEKLDLNFKYFDNLDDKNILTEYPLFCTFYTLNGYENYFSILQESIKNFNLPFCGFELKSKTNSYVWEYITQLKPFVLLYILNKFKKNIVWIDADAKIEKLPIYFLDVNNNISVNYNFNKFYRKSELLSGTIFFKYSEISISILDDWIKKTEEINNNKIINKKDLWDQYILQKVLENYKKYIDELPKEYISIFDHPDFKNLDWVISHWQGSRQLKNYNNLNTVTIK